MARHRDFDELARNEIAGTACTDALAQQFLRPLAPYGTQKLEP